MPLLHAPLSLTAASLSTIARNFDFLCYGATNKQEMARMLEDDTYLRCKGPFLDLPSAILEQALAVIQDDTTIRHVKTRHLHVLLQPQLECLELSFGSGDVHVALELLQARCRKLRRLRLSYLRTLYPPELLRVTPHLSTLVWLDLSYTECDDMVLASVGHHCELLREFNLTCCPITDKGLNRLLWNSRQQEKQCHYLTSINVSGCQITPAAVRSALQLRPTLRHVEHENNLLAFEARHSGLWEDDPDTLFNIVALNAQNFSVSDVAMETAVTLCPFVTAVSLTGCRISSEALMRTSAWPLTQFSFVNTDAHYQTQLQFSAAVLPVLAARGDQLTALLLSKFTCIDIAVIGVACPNVENLALSGVGLYDHGTETPPSAAPFQRLRVLELWSEPGNNSLNAATLRLLLRHCEGLRNLLVSGGGEFGDALLEELWQVNPMSQLTRLTVDSCLQFTHVSLQQLLERINAVSFVRVWNCPGVTKVHEMELLRRIREGNMDVYFEWYAWTG